MTSSIWTNDARRPATLTAGVLLVASLTAIALRLGEWIPNVTAVGALALYAGGRLRWWLAWLPPIAVMATADWILQGRGKPGFYWSVYACFLLDVLVGRALARGSSPMRIGLAGFVGALQFFLITNFVEWLKPSNPAVLLYPHTMAGLEECYIAALPFFGYTLLGNLAFSAAFFGGEALAARVITPEPAVEKATETA
ncbi:MAG TPA: DUF6580 family putative transport protein [Gemmataceae bacterium]|jgi:hypothetical protein|nr:DUF6580 family putative transport protein [Gemmataceae bacterium]